MSSESSGERDEFVGRLGEWYRLAQASHESDRQMRLAGEHAGMLALLLHEVIEFLASGSPAAPTSDRPSACVEGTAPGATEQPTVWMD